MVVVENWSDGGCGGGNESGGVGGGSYVHW